MTSVTLSPQASTTVIQSPSSSVFEAVTRSTSGLAIWQRNLSSETVEAVDIVRRAQVNETIFLACHDYPYAVSHPFLNNLPAALRDDLCKLILFFRNAANASAIKLRLETVTDHACRRLHVDNVRLRIVTTYAGAGTQWAPPEIEEYAVATQQAYAGPLRQLETGDVALFRGKKCMKGAHVYHRSPPISTGQSRLVCVIDEACDQ